MTGVEGEQCFRKISEIVPTTGNSVWLSRAHLGRKNQSDQRSNDHDDNQELNELHPERFKNAQPKESDDRANQEP
ncbi:hypothetical protein [Lacipirellula parvula]|uniref:hypothetical protein n=1 Tax=Lacipirellula parvula TaxID=2650471 RepID=UPI001E5D1EC5|nr:hypothetical protein [Lacipirellula parvula]